MERRTRQLAAIMFADMVGYTALMQEDEERAHAQRERQREVLSEIVPAHNGEVLQYYGDGTLSVFTSAVEAVECAVAIQLAMRTDPKVPLRIGVHTGDIVHDELGVYGDGLNVAARIESLADPGGIVLSGKVFDEIKNHSSLTTHALGQVTLKNVKLPLMVYAVANQGLSVPSAEAVHARAARGGDASAMGGETPAAARSQPPAAVGAGEAFLRAVRERALIQWGVVYLAVAGSLVWIGSFLSGLYSWPSFVRDSLWLISFTGFFVTLVVAWYHGERGRQRIRGTELVIYFVLLLSSGAALTVLWTRPPAGPGRETTPLPVATAGDARPSVAVLPFENRSAEAENAYFASGLHDEVMTQLLRIGGLRVISRTSVMEYADARPNVRVIAENLGVSHVAVASVQRSEDRLRVNVQLTDASTDTNVWANRYDADVTDAFAVQSDIAQQIADALATTLTAQERNAITQSPTTNPEAYRLYLQGRDYFNRPGYRQENYLAAEQLFERALERDPEFALAHAELSLVHGNLYWENFDPSPSRLEAQRNHAEEALRRGPELPQAHQALGWSHYVGGDYMEALSEFEIARSGMPNDAEIIARIGYAHRRLGNWSEVFETFEEATRLSPRNATLYYDLGGHSFLANRRYSDAASAYGRAEFLAPDLYDAAIHKGHTYVHWRGQLDTLAAVIDRLPPNVHTPETNLARVDFALWNRDGEALLRYLDAVPTEALETQILFRPKALYAAWAHRLRGDGAAAHAAFLAAEASLDRRVAESPDDQRVIASLGFVHAGLGQREDAAGYGFRLLELEQRAGYPSEGPQNLEMVSRIFAQANLPDVAIPHLEALLESDSPISTQTLRADPLLDPIRQHPEFEALLARHERAP